MYRSILRRPSRSLAAVPAGVGLVATALLVGPSPGAAFAATTDDVALASHVPSSPNTAANGQSAFTATSGDGNVTAFASDATNLVDGQADGNAARDVFIHEPATGTTTLVSHVPGGATTTANLASGFPRVSGNGAFVVFHSYADDLVEGQSGARGNIFLFERATGRVTLVSHAASDAKRAVGDTYPITSISADGAYVAFESYASDVVDGQDESASGVSNDMFLFERATGKVTLVSHLPNGAAAAAGEVYDSPSISGDGGYVAFTSGAPDLVDRQTDNPYSTGDVFLFERSTGRVTLVSHIRGRSDATGNAPSGNPVVSANGAFVVFESSASDLVGRKGDDNGTFDVFLFERASGAVTLVSHTPDSDTTTGDNSSHSDFAISGDGGYVAFTSFATNLVPGQADANSNDDVFLFRRDTRTVALVSHTAANAKTAGDGMSHFPSISADGASVAFMSEASDLVRNQKDSAFLTSDIFLWDRPADSTTLVSHTPKHPSTTANDSSGLRPGGRGPEIDAPRLSADGRTVAFVSLATDLVTGQVDANGAVDAFVFRKG